MSQEYKRPESVLVVIYTAASEVLLLERQQPAGYWQSVTGSLKGDETPLQAALREVREETGLDVGDRLVDTGCTNRFEILPAWRSRYAPDVRYNTEHVFLAELPQRLSVQLNDTEHRRFRWLPALQAALEASSHTNQAAIERYVLRR
ncbi:MAG TPA: dihydroneopterin triphosphate diphosphatase [Gammaproteobacteria bacterium]|nr:dihydroneopterin triphosphate diphosphatase [Gammaproteobacteria bacterium]